MKGGYLQRTLSFTPYVLSYNWAYALYNPFKRNGLEDTYKSKSIGCSLVAQGNWGLMM